jgi:hypothetical protein
MLDLAGDSARLAGAPHRLTPQPVPPRFDGAADSASPAPLAPGASRDAIRLQLRSENAPHFLDRSLALRILPGGVWQTEWN